MKKESTVKKNKTLNILKVLDYVRDHQEVTTNELSQNIGIPIASTYRIIQTMSASGLLTCVDKLDAPAGRKAGIYTVNPNYKLMLGIYLRKTYADFFINNMLGEILSEQKIYYPENCELKDVCNILDDGICNITQQLFGNEGVENISILGVTAEAAVNIASGEIVKFDALGCLNGFNIRSYLLQKYGLKAYFMKSAQLVASIYIKDMMSLGIQNYVHMSVSYGIGVGIVENGNYYQGSNCNAGELGALLNAVDPYLMADLYRDTIEYLSKPENEKTKELLKAGDIFQIGSNELVKLVDTAVAEGEQYISGLVEKACESIVKICDIISDLLDPQAIIVGGDISKKVPNICKMIYSIADKYNIKAEIKTAFIKKSRNEMAAVCLVDRAYEKLYEELNEEV